MYEVGRMGREWRDWVGLEVVGEVWGLVIEGIGRAVVVGRGKGQRGGGYGGNV